MIVYIYNLKTNQKEMVFKNVFGITNNKRDWCLTFLHEDETMSYIEIEKKMRKIVVYGF